MNTGRNRKRIKEATLLIVGLARNCEKVIAQEVSNISKCFSDFKKVNWLIVESDSDDNTVKVLGQLSREQPGFSFLSLGRLRDKLKLRTERIAHCRNAYIERLLNDPGYAEVDYLVVADMDGVNNKLTPEAVHSCWDIQDDWNACFANQSKRYYDLWALRHPLWSPNDCFAQRNFYKSHGHKALAFLASVYARMLDIPQDAAPIEVDSAFGGLGIYQRSLITDCNYIGISETGGETCEHVAFNLAMKSKGAKLYINPKMVNNDYNEHSNNWVLMKRFLGLFLLPDFLIKK